MGNIEGNKHVFYIHPSWIGRKVGDNYYQRCASFIDDFASNINKGDGNGCWIWEGKFLYGRKNGKPIPVYRKLGYKFSPRAFIFLLFVKALPKHRISMRCENATKCVRPDHFQITERHTEQLNRKHTQEDADYVRELYYHRGYTIEDIVDDVGMTSGIVKRIINNQIYKEKVA